MIAVVMPAFIVALVPVVVIEAYVFKRAGFPFGWALTWNTIANLVTTLIGVPLVWFILFGLTLLTIGTSCGESINTLADRILWTVLRTPWLCPLELGLRWVVPAAFLLLLVPFFLMSWLIESLIIRKANKSRDPLPIHRASLHANLASYVLLALYSVILYIFEP